MGQDAQPGADVAFAPGLNLRATVSSALDRHDVHPRIVLESNDPLTVRNLAAAGLGYALLPASVAPRPRAPDRHRTDPPTGRQPPPLPRVAGRPKAISGRNPLHARRRSCVDV